MKGSRRLWAILTNPSERRRLFHSAVKDIGRIFIVAVVLDTAYQILFLRTFYIVQLFIVAVDVLHRAVRPNPRTNHTPHAQPVPERGRTGKTGADQMNSGRKAYAEC